MGRNRFISADTRWLELGDGDRIEVRDWLSGTEKRKVAGAGLIDVQQTGKPEAPKVGIDFAASGLARTKAYLVNWNFCDKNSRPIKFSISAVDTLDEETLLEIEQALDEHVEARTREKKAQSGAAGLALVSPAADSSTGAGPNT